MKNSGVITSLKLIPAFIVLLVGGSLAGSCLYTLYAACTIMISGESLSVLSVNIFLKGLFVAIPVSASLSSAFLIFFIIRHPQKSVFPIITYFILGATIWFCILPICNKLSVHFMNNMTNVDERKFVSDGLFRKNDSLIIYYSSITKDGTADGLCFDTKDNTGCVYTFNNIPLLNQNRTFNDSLIEETVTMPKLMSLIAHSNIVLVNQGVDSCSEGIISWLLFATLGIALVSVIGLRKITYWRLLNLFLVIFSTTGILFLNALYYGSNIFDNVAVFVGDKVSRLIEMKDPFIVLCNIIIALVFLITGFVIDIIKHNSPLNEEG